MSQNFKTKKVERKQRRCAAIVSADCGVESSEAPTPYIALLNAGLSTGLTEEQVFSVVVSHGHVKQLLMLPHKSYCFLECATAADAKCIFDNVHNVATIGQSGAVVYMGYFNQLPSTIEKNVWAKPLPAGLIVLSDFVTCEEEEELLCAVAIGKTSESKEAALVDNGNGNIGSLKHRRVRHFGYEFLYGVNNVDTSKPLEQHIPVACEKLWLRLQEIATKENISLGWETPDQLTVNEYEPGQGIPQHVDTHSAFLEPILSLSLEGDIVMEFRRSAERIPVVLKRRSLLIMSGEARYDWTHGITPRMLDVVPTEKGLTIEPRVKRTSLTFRRLRRAPCNCTYPTLCDTHIQAKQANPRDALSTTVLEACSLEEQNVHTVYERIASHFSETRHSPWPRVCDFLRSFALGSVVLDVGCGNGKYLGCQTNLLILGCDRSSGLLNVCAERAHSVFRCDCLQVPVRSNSLDGCISIAVIHHLATPQRRLAAVQEMARLLRPGGRALIYVWAKNQRTEQQKSSYLLQNKSINKHKTTVEQQRQLTAQQLDINCSSPLPIHTNRTEFQQQDVLVPWIMKGSQQNGKQATTYLRYYHVFEAEELEQLVAQVPDAQLLQSYYDQGNHCVIFERK